MLPSPKVISVGARGTYADLGKLNADSKETGYRANATFVDQFADARVVPYSPRAWHASNAHCCRPYSW